MQKPKPFVLYGILAGFCLCIIWIPVLQNSSRGGDSLFSIQTWLALSGLASFGIILLFCILYFIRRN